MIGDAQVRISTDQFTQAIPVAAIEALDIDVEQRRQFRIDHGLGPGVIAERRQLGAASLECSLHPTDGRADEIRNFVQRIVEDVLEKHAGSLLGWQIDHKSLDGAVQRPTDGLDWRRPIRLNSGCLGLVANAAFPQEVDTAIMRDSEQPGTQGTTVVIDLQLPIALEQRLLHDVLAIQDRTGYARAVTMQPRTEVSDRFQKGDVTRLKEASRFEFGLNVHHGITQPGAIRIRRSGLMSGIYMAAAWRGKSCKWRRERQSIPM